MELNSLKNVELLRKGLYAKQLQHYSNLCKIYEDILKSESKSAGYISKTAAEKVFAKYAPLLNAASKGDYSFLDTQNLSVDEEEIFKTFAYHSAKMAQFRTADALLKDVIDVDAKTQKPTLSTTNLNKFKSFMNEPLECETNEDYVPTFRQDDFENSKILRTHTASRLLDLTIGRPDSKFKYGHSPRWLGHFFFKMSKESLNLISSIDPSHLPNGFSIADQLTPASFGAEITGVKGYIQKFIEKFQKKDKSSDNIVEMNPDDLENYDPFTEKEKDYLKKKPGNFHEKFYNQAIKASHGSLNRVLAGTAALAVFAGALLFTVPSIANSRDFNAATKIAEVQKNKFTTPMSLDELNNVTNDFANQQYTNIADFKEDANYTLDAIQQTCQTYLNQYNLPTADELKGILTNLDDVTSMLVEKPLELAYQNAYPGYSNFKADLFYNDAVTDHRDLTRTTTEEGIRLTATDPNGNEISTTIPDIQTPLGSTDLLDRALQKERHYDRDFNSVFNALVNPEAINPETGKNYTYSEVRDLCNALLETIMQDCEVARTLTKADIIILKDGSIAYLVETEPDHTTDTTEHADEPTINDDGPELD